MVMYGFVRLVTCNTHMMHTAHGGHMARGHQVTSCSRMGGGELLDSATLSQKSVKTSSFECFIKPSRKLGFNHRDKCIQESEVRGLRVSLCKSFIQK